MVVKAVLKTNKDTNELASDVLLGYSCGFDEGRASIGCSASHCFLKSSVTSSHFERSPNPDTSFAKPSPLKSQLPSVAVILFIAIVSKICFVRVYADASEIPVCTSNAASMLSFAIAASYTSLCKVIVQGA